MPCPSLVYVTHRRMWSRHAAKLQYLIISIFDFWFVGRNCNGVPNAAVGRKEGRKGAREHPSPLF